MKHEILIYNKTKCQVPEKLIRSIILGSLGFLKLKQPVELAVLVVSAKEIRKLNKIWRKKDYTPDELSFGLNSRLSAERIKLDKKQSKVLELGEIVINNNKISDRNNLAEILVHSLLHLLGYNHEKSAVKAKKMEKIERRILKYLKI